MSPRIPWLTALVLGSACATTPPPLSSPPPPPAAPCPAGAAAAPARLSVRLQARPRGAVLPRNLLPDDRLRPDEQIALQVWADRPLHLYVSQRGGAVMRRLFQARDDRPRAPEDPLRIPEGDRFLDVPGAGALYVAASQVPLWEAAPRECQALRLRCAPRPEGQRGDEEQEDSPETPDSEEPPPPPPGMDQTDRWPRQVMDGRLVQVSTDRCGVALLTWPLTAAP